MTNQTKDLSKSLILSSSPHFHGRNDTSRIMLDVLIALVPVVVMSTVIFGWRVFINVLISALTCVVAEYISRKVMKASITITDLSAIVTGVILALNVPAEFPIWQLMLGGVAAIVLVKQIFGGLGHNFANPAMIARLMLVVSFGNSFINSLPKVDWSFADSVDATSAATPMAVLAGGADAVSEAPSYLNMLLGVHGSVAVGETCAAAILLGCVYLLIRKVIKPHIPVTYILTVAVLALLFSGFDFDFMLYQILGGGLLFGAVFMATDYATSPLTDKGKIIFGIGLGLITCFIRFWGSLPEGVSYSIVIMNILTPHIDNWTRSPIFGSKNQKKGVEA